VVTCIFDHFIRAVGSFLEFTNDGVEVVSFYVCSSKSIYALEAIYLCILLYFDLRSLPCVGVCSPRNSFTTSSHVRLQGSSLLFSLNLTSRLFLFCVFNSALRDQYHISVDTKVVNKILEIKGSCDIGQFLEN
jgi:hypothetical protein